MASRAPGVRGHSAPRSGRVLYVADSRTLATVMLHVLEGMGLTVDHYANTTAAPSALGQRPYDPIVSDILVESGLSGIGLTSRIRENSAEPIRTPILAISGGEDDNRRIDLFRLDINDFVIKPVLEDEGRARVSNLVMNKPLLERVEEQRRHLYDLAMTDQLTGRYNRNSLSEFAEAEMAEAHRHDFPLSVIVIDIDQFKQINDRFGHPFGDEILAAAGELLQHSTPSEDVAVRFGGEALLLILVHWGAAHAGHRGERLRGEIASMSFGDGIGITASVGVAARPDGRTIDVDVLVRGADSAGYEANTQGRNRVVTNAAEPASLAAE